MINSTLKLIRERIHALFPAQRWTDVDVVVAVSGGPDSVALLRALDEIKRSQTGRGQLIVAHCNHQTREHCDLDQEFVRQIAGQLGLPFRVAIKPPAAFDATAGISEETLRNWRYQALLSIARSIGARYLATAHNADDQAETILFRMIRGTGIGGLQGIPRVRTASDVTIIRPLITTSRQEIEKFLEELGQPFQSDATNLDARYARNFIRNQLMPQIRQRFGSTIDGSLLQIALQSQELHEFLDQQIADFRDSAILSRSDSHIELNANVLRDQPDILLRHMLMRLWSEFHWPAGDLNAKWLQILTNMIKLGSDKAIQKQSLPGKITAQRTLNSLRLARNEGNAL